MIPFFSKDKFLNLMFSEIINIVSQHCPTDYIKHKRLSTYRILSYIRLIDKNTSNIINIKELMTEIKQNVTYSTIITPTFVLPSKEELSERYGE